MERVRTRTPAPITFLWGSIAILFAGRFRAAEEVVWVGTEVQGRDFSERAGGPNFSSAV